MNLKNMFASEKFKIEPFIKKLMSVVDDVYDSTEYKDRREDMNRWLSEYGGEWWNKDKIKEYESEVFVNFIFSTVETNAPLLTDNRPQWYVAAREPYLQNLMNIYAKALDYAWDKLDLDGKLYLVTKDSQIFPVGLWKVWFDPDQEKFGEVRVDLVDPRKFIIAPGYIDPWDCAWCGEIQRKPMSWVKLFFPDKFKFVKPDNETESDYSKYEEFELEDKYVTIYEVWLRDSATEEYIEKYEFKNEAGESEEKEEKKYRRKYPNGRVVCFTKNGVKLNDKASPYKHGKSPYVPFYDYRFPHSFWGMGEPVQIENLNREFNLRLQQLVHHAHKHAKPNYMVDAASGLDPEQVKQTMPEGDNVYVVNFANTPDPIKIVTESPIHPVHEKLLAGISNSIEEVSGVTDIFKGMATKKQRQSASEVSILIESSYVRTRQRVRNLEWSIRRSLYLVLELMQQYYTEPRSFSYAEGSNRIWGTIGNSINVARAALQPNPINPEIEGDQERYKQEETDCNKLIQTFGEKNEVYAAFDLEVQTNSTLPMDKQSLANLGVQLANVQITPHSGIDRKALLEILRFPKADEILDRLEKQQQLEMAAKAPPAGSMPGMQMGPPQTMIPKPGGVTPGAAPGAIET